MLINYPPNLTLKMTILGVSFLTIRIFIYTLLTGINSFNKAARKVWLSKKETLSSPHIIILYEN